MHERSGQTKSLALNAGVFACSLAPMVEAASWNGGAAAAYLDGRETWWQGWSKAQRDYDTARLSER